MGLISFVEYLMMSAVRYIYRFTIDYMLIVKYLKFVSMQAMQGSLPIEGDCFIPADFATTGN